MSSTSFDAAQKRNLHLSIAHKRRLYIFTHAREGSQGISVSAHLCRHPVSFSALSPSDVSLTYFSEMGTVAEPDLPDLNQISENLSLVSNVLVVLENKDSVAMSYHCFHLVCFVSRLSTDKHGLSKQHAFTIRFFNIF